MIYIDIYRARIGCFNQPVTKKLEKFARRSKCSKSTQNIYLCKSMIVCMTLLIISLVTQLWFSDILSKEIEHNSRNRDGLMSI